MACQPGAHLLRGDVAYDSSAVWSYGPDGRPTSIDFTYGDSRALLAITWSDLTVEVTGPSVSSRYIYDPTRDKLIVEHGQPTESRQEFRFLDDGSYNASYYIPRTDGTWREVWSGMVDRWKVEGRGFGELGDSDTEVVERDVYGNPLLADHRTAFYEDRLMKWLISQMVWEVEYR